MVSYCTKCGKQLNDNDSFCPNCGTKNRGCESQAGNSYQTGNTYQTGNAYHTGNTYQTGNGYNQDYYRPYCKTPTQVLADRERASAVVWTIIACLQGVISLLTISGLSILGNIIGIPLGWGGLFMMALAAYNGYAAYCSFQRVKRVLSRQRGIVWEYDRMLTSCIVFIVLNALFGAIIGIAGAVFDLFNRNYALNNAQYLED